MKSVVIAALAGFAAAHSEIEAAFMSFMAEHGKTYRSVAEYNWRLEHFAAKHIMIEAHNMTESSYKLGHNKFSDWTDSEYANILTYKPIEHVAEETAVDGAATPINWVDLGAVSPVQDQGQCGSCWAFSSVSAAESAHEIATGHLEKFSEQQLVDCVRLCFGCNGGNQAIAFNYYESHYAMSEASYPYTAKNGTCAYSSSDNLGVKVTTYTSVTADSPDAMKTALQTAPLAVAIQANQLSFQMYSSGVFTNTNCGTNLDHATNVVGWGESGSQQYWIMRNSWGTSWGESGYMKLEIVSGHGLCGIQMQPLYPTTN